MDQAHSLATERLPWFVTKPGETDILLVITAVLLLVMAIAFGVLLLRLHHLPEHLAGKSQKIRAVERMAHRRGGRWRENMK